MTAKLVSRSLRGRGIRTLPKHNVDNRTTASSSSAAAASQSRQTVQSSTESTAGPPTLSNPFLKGPSKHNPSMKGPAEPPSSNPFLKKGPSQPSSVHFPSQHSSNPFMKSLIRPISSSVPPPSSTALPPSYAQVVGTKKMFTQTPKFELQESSNHLQPPMQQTNFNPFLAKQPVSNPHETNAGGMPSTKGLIGQSKLATSYFPPPPPPYDGSSRAVSNNSSHFSRFAAPSQQKSGYDPRTRTQGANAVSSTALHLKALPADFNNEAFLMNHFSKFGHPVAIKCNTAKMYATVSFKTHVSCS